MPYGVCPNQELDSRVMSTDRYGDQPCFGELVAIVLIGLGHVIIEVAFTLQVAKFYNVAVSIAAVSYIVWRVRRSPNALRVWGFRTDNIGPAMRAQLPFLAVSIIGLIVFAVVTGSAGLPKTFWFTIVLYPVWGIVQQFALQNFIANNLKSTVSSVFLLSLVAALIFAVSHYPRMELVALSLVGGFFFTLAYRKHPNLWVVGTVHGILGSMVFYIVMGQDPGAEIIKLMAGS
ncbi:MAG: CPBP family glutamic-type intramembrane protease [Planctomycetota bacterium]